MKSKASGEHFVPVLATCLYRLGFILMVETSVQIAEVSENSQQERYFHKI